MTVSTVTHLNFHGQAREALTFYSSVFAGRTTVATYGDFGMPPELPDADKIVWGQVLADTGFQVMAYDVPSHGGSDRTPISSSTRREHGLTLTDQQFFVSVRGDSVDEVQGFWTGLSDGATVIESFGPSAWAPAFGMLTDRFGVTWILDVATQPQS